MCKRDNEAFVVKFVESEGSQSEHAVKAYEVNFTVWLDLYSCLNINFFAVMSYVCVTFLQAILELQSDKYIKNIKEEDVLQMEQKDKSLFVFSSFTSSGFLHCKKVRVSSVTQKLWNGKHYWKIIFILILKPLVFFYVSQLGCRIVSPLVVLHCLQHQRCVPRAEKPVYNMAMADVTISCTNLDKATRVSPDDLVLYTLINVTNIKHEAVL